MSDSAPQVGDDATVAGLDGPGARLPLRDAQTPQTRDATTRSRACPTDSRHCHRRAGPGLRVVTEDGEIGWVAEAILSPTGATDGAPPAEDLQWTHWINPRFGMSIDYPAALFRPERAPENGDGQFSLRRPTDGPDSLSMASGTRWNLHRGDARDGHRHRRVRPDHREPPLSV